MSDLREGLSQPFAPESIEWKPGSTTKDKSKCLAMAFGDTRAYQDRLDDVCGLNWSVRYQVISPKAVLCELTVDGVTRSATGEDDDLMSTEARAFKRACAMFGLGRYLYDLPAVWVAFDSGASRISKEGQAELDRRYREWYQKTMAASKPRTVTTSPAKVQVEENGDVIFAVEKPRLSESQQKKLHAVGTRFYGAEWEERRHELVKVITSGKHTSSNDLTPEQADRLINGIEKKMRDIEAQEAREAQPA